MRVRLISTAAAVALLASSTLALAQTSAPKKPLGKLTCEEFLAYEDTFKPKVVHWAVAYGKGGKRDGAFHDHSPRFLCPAAKLDGFAASGKRMRLI